VISFGSVPANSVLPIPFDSFAGATGASITITGLAVTDIEVYKGASMTQRSSDAGYVLMDTDGIDLDGVTGIQGFSIDTSDNTDAGFYAVGSFFWVVVSAITVDAQTVNFLAATFRIVTAEGITGTPKADVDGWRGTAVAVPTTAGIPTARLSAAGVDDILDDALTEPSATFTWAGATLRTVIAWIGSLSRNKITQTSTTQTLRNDADGANISTSTVSDDGTTFTRGEWT